MDTVALAALRLDLTNQGVRISEDLLASGFAMAFADTEPAEGLDLILPGGWCCNVCVAPGYARTSPYELIAHSDESSGFCLRHRTRGDTPVTVPSTARFRHATAPSGVSCGEIGAVHGHWLVIAPFTPRESVGLDRPRRFLGLPPQRRMSKSQWSIDEVVACAEAAWRHAEVRLIHLEAGHLLAADGGVAALAPYLSALHRALPTLVSVSVLPPESPDAVLDLYAAGCDAVSYHLLASDEAAAARVAPIRLRFVPHARTHAALRAAARIFPPGAVSTDLLVGLEPLADLERSIAQFIDAGIVPNLALFRPLPGAEDDAPHGELVPTEPLLRLFDNRRQRIATTRLWHSRVRGFPRTLWGSDRYAPGVVQRCYASLRRSLRVLRQDSAA